jgi:hypothetical protein
MEDALTLEAEVARARGLLPELARVMLPAICPLILEYSGDVRRLFFEGLFQFVHKLLGVRAINIRRAVTVYACSISRTSGLHEWWAVQLNAPAGRLQCRASCDATPFARLKRPECSASVEMPPPQELWDFLCGNDSPTVRWVIACCPLTVPTDAVVGYVRRSLRRKAAYWCAIHECAAIARIWLGHPRDA